MKLTSSTIIDDMLKEYPFLIDFLPTLSPKYKKLKSPLARKTMGKVATLEMVAKVGGFDIDTLISEVEKEIGRRGASVQPTVESLEARKEILKGIIRDLHNGVEMEVLKQRFAELIKDVSPLEISEMEQGLMDEGMPESEVKRLCDVHVEVFKRSLDAQEKPSCPPGHPVHTFMLENRESEDIMERITLVIERLGTPPDEKVFKEKKEDMIALFGRLSEMDRHYLRKENQLFPLLESHGVSGPSRVMWAIHDDIRMAIKNGKGQLSEDRVSEAVTSITETVRMIKDMIYKEEQILYPMSLETLTDGDWSKVKEGEGEIGYAWIEPGLGWEPEIMTAEVAAGEEKVGTKKLSLDTGSLSLEQINLLLTHLPVDISFVDERGEVAYYSAGKERIFPRSPGVIGREVNKCHPPKSVHVVEKIIEEFKAGKKDVAEFWIQMGGKMIYIRYFAVRDPNGSYKGILEVSQDVTEIKKLEGERRLLDWE